MDELRAAERLPAVGLLVGAAAWASRNRRSRWARRPLVATDGLYGFDFASYVWRGYGLYTQLWGMLLLPPALVQGYVAVLNASRPITRASPTGKGFNG